MKLILASTSPRRQKILSNITKNFQIVAPEINENKNLFSMPSNACKYYSKIKALAVSKKYKKDLVVGADTIVYIKKKIMYKPINRKEAFQQLNYLSGKTHSVYTGVTFIIDNENIMYSFFSKTYVTFYVLSKKQIMNYINKYDPLDKCGSYGIQDWSMIFVKSINGCYNNVLGFPLASFYKNALNFNINITKF